MKLVEPAGNLPRAQIPMPFKNKPKIRYAAAAVAVIVSVLGTAGCSSDNSNSQAGIYGIYEGSSGADYGHGGAAAPTQDNGFSVDGVSRDAPPVQTAKADPLASKDTLAGGGSGDTLDNSSNVNAKVQGKNGDSLDTGSDTLSRGSGNDDSESPKNGLDSGTNDTDFYSYWLVGNVDDSSITVTVNGTPLAVYGDHVDQDISSDVHPGINKVVFVYTPNDTTSRAHMSIMRGAQPPLPLSASFDSLMDRSSTPSVPVVTKTSYFIGE